MNTHDIELPEHWQAFQYSEIWEAWEQVIPSAADEPGVVKAYTEDQVRAAIEADRQARGEPVALMVEAAQHLTNWLDMDNCECDGYSHSCGKAQVELCRDRLLAAAPQPAEPYRKALHDLIRDLEMRSKLKRGDDKGVVDCGNGVYLQALMALGELK